MEIKNLRKTFKNFSLTDVNMTIEKGQVMGFVGPNGAGKTTIIKLVLNLIKPESGSIKIFGLDHLTSTKDIKQRIGFVYDELPFFDNFSIKRNKHIVSRFYRNWDNDLFNNLLCEFELNSNMKLKELSKGMKLKFFLAVALSHHPELLIMDEPTSNLDPLSRKKFFELLQRFLKENPNRSILFTTHYPEDLQQIADQVTYINKGEVIFSYRKEFLKEDVAIVKGPINVYHSLGSKEIIGVEKFDDHFVGLVVDFSKKKSILKDKITIIKEPPLEEIMYYIDRQRKEKQDEKYSKFTP